MAFIVTPVEVDPRALTLPKLAELSPELLNANYYQPADTLYVHFYGKALPAISVPLDTGNRDFLYMRVTPDTRHVVGLQIEGVATYAITRLPSIKPLVSGEPTAPSKRFADLVLLVEDVRRMMPGPEAAKPAARRSA